MNAGGSWGKVKKRGQNNRIERREALGRYRERRKRKGRRKGVQYSVQRLYPVVKYPDVQIPHCQYLEKMHKILKILCLSFIIEYINNNTFLTEVLEKF